MCPPQKIISCWKRARAVKELGRIKSCALAASPIYPSPPSPSSSALHYFAFLWTWQILSKAVTADTEYLFRKKIEGLLPSYCTWLYLLLNLSTITNFTRIIRLVGLVRGEREWLLGIREREWIINSIPKVWEREGNGKKTIPKIWEREGNGKKPFPKFGNGKGIKKSQFHISGEEIRGYHFREYPGTGTGMEKKWYDSIKNIQKKCGVRRPKHSQPDPPPFLIPPLLVVASATINKQNSKQNLMSFTITKSFVV